MTLIAANTSPFGGRPTARFGPLDPLPGNAKVRSLPARLNVTRNIGRQQESPCQQATTSKV